MLLKLVLSLGLPFLITYTSGSNWYICFSFSIIIYSFVCQFSLRYYWYCYVRWCSAKKVFLHISQNFTRKHLRSRLVFNEVADLQSLTLSTGRFRHRCFPVNSAKFLIAPFLKNLSDGCFPINSRSVYFPITTFRLFKNDVTGCPAEYFLDLICRLGARVCTIFPTLSQKPIFNPVEYLRWSLFCKNS